MTANVDGMSERLTIRDVNDDDLSVLKSVAQEQGTSLNKYVTSVLHEHAQRERHKRLFAAVAAQDDDVPPYDAVAEVRAMRVERDAEDDREVDT